MAFDDLLDNAVSFLKRHELVFGDLPRVAVEIVRFFWQVPDLVIT